jgi:hypothetical protein
MAKRLTKGVCANPQCRREFTINVPWQKYCSDRCRFVGWVLSRVRFYSEKKA